MSGLEEITASYINSLSYVKSIDGFLIKTTTMVYNVEEYCRVMGCDPVETVRDILMDPRVRRFLTPFSCYRDNISSQVSSDPRYKKLRKYLDAILGVLETLECKGRWTYHSEIIVETPPALWYKESREAEERSTGARPPGAVLSPRPHRLKVVEPGVVEKVLLGMMILSLILIIMYFLMG